MDEIIVIKDVKYVVVEREFTGNYKLGESVAVVCLRRPLGRVFYYADEILTANGYQYRLAGLSA